MLVLDQRGQLPSFKKGQLQWLRLAALLHQGKFEGLQPARTGIKCNKKTTWDARNVQGTDLSPKLQGLFQS